MSTLKSKFISAPVNGPTVEPLVIQTNNLDRVTVDSSGNVGIGTSSPSSYTSGDQLVIASASGNGQMSLAGADNGNPTIQFRRVSAPSTTRGYIQYDNTSDWLRFATNGTERARIDSSGRLLVNATADMNAGKFQVNGNTDVSALFKCANNSVNNIRSWMATASGTRFHVAFADGTTFTERGSISTNGTSTTYSTSSDYRLKENITPITGAMAKVAQMRPVDWTWKENGAAGQGFIAHELQAVIPDAVVGEKDEVDENGNPRYQSVDTSFLVATLTAAIQELKAELDATKAEVAALKAQP